MIGICLFFFLYIKFNSRDFTVSDAHFENKCPNIDHVDARDQHCRAVIANDISSYINRL